MSSLKEKAKTGFEIEAEIARHRMERDKKLRQLLEEQWVRLEDAQKEIDELKRKLQRLSDLCYELPNIVYDALGRNSYYEALVREIKQLLRHCV